MKKAKFPKIEKEDSGLLKLMTEVDWNDTIPVEHILKKLRSRIQRE